MSLPFQDRTDAGRQLASRLRAFADRADVIVLGLPRGGVPVAHEVARKLEAPLDVLLVRKLGVPGHEELAMGAIASGGGIAPYQDTLRPPDITPEEIERGAAHQARGATRGGGAAHHGLPGRAQARRTPAAG